jgi:hypothetical protein
MKILIYLFLAISFLFSCKGSADDESIIEGQTADGFEDGTYCADVTYYNPNTGTSNDYTLDVEVSGNEVVQLNFGNGGWLDSSHMSPETLDENGECTITSDKNYEYSIKITGSACGSSGDVNPETDEDMPRYTFSQCTEILSLSKEEIENCLTMYSKDDVLSENGLKNLEEYIFKIREINNDYKNQVNDLNRKKNNLDNEVNEGYIQGVYFYTAHETATCHQIIVLKHGKYYWLQVRGNSKCSTGTMKFNENSSDWQSVPVRYSPNSSSYSVYSMKIMGEGSNRSALDAQIKKYCSF